MPIRAIKEPRYKGISELYRQSDGKVTGYYVTYRDLEGRPVKKRVEASDRDEALQRLHEIRNEIEKRRKEREMSSIPPRSMTTQEDELEMESAAAAAEPAPRSSGKREKTSVRERSDTAMLQRRFSEYDGIGVAMLFEIVAYEDLVILYGFEAAEEILRQLGSRIEDELHLMENERFFARHGLDSIDSGLHSVFSDRLVLVLRKDLPHRLIERIVERLLRRIAHEKFEIGEEYSAIHLQATCGIAKGQGPQLLPYAQKALAESRHYRSEYIYYDQNTVRNQAKSVKDIYHTLLENIRNERVTPYFQGLFSGNDIEIPQKFECLMRLRHKDGEILSPALFMEKSKEYRLYTQLMFQMIDRVFEVLQENRVDLTLNLSYGDICNPELCDHLQRKIEESGAGERLTIEILESENIRSMDEVNEFIFAMKRYGVKIAIDDFGSGFSNLDNILSLDVDYVKLDGSLISKIRNEKHRELLRSVVGICHDLGIETVAEFVSDREIMLLAKSIGVDYFQGYYLHKPSDWESVLEEFGPEGGSNV